MQQINKAMLNKVAEQVRTDPETLTFLPTLTQQQQVKTNVFCNDLHGALGVRFTRELQSEEQEQQFKRTNGLLIDSFTEDDIRSGFRKIASLRARNELVIYELADVFPIFDRYQLSSDKKAKMYREYLDGGIEITRDVKHPQGHFVKQTIGREWTSGVMLALSGVLGSPKYHGDVHGKNARAVFDKELAAILLRLKRGEKFELPTGIEDKSSRPVDMKGYQERNTGKKNNFMENIKKFRAYKDKINTLATYAERNSQGFLNNDWQPSVDKGFTERQAIDEFMKQFKGGEE